MSDRRPRALHELLQQHELLRALMDRCDQLASKLTGASDSPLAQTLELCREIVKLRSAFGAYNLFEAKVLRNGWLDGEPLHDPGFASEPDRDHHAASPLAAELRPDVTPLVLAELRAVLATMRAHLETEAHLLNVRLARDGQETRNSLRPSQGA